MSILDDIMTRAVSHRTVLDQTYIHNNKKVKKKLFRQTVGLMVLFFCGYFVVAMGPVFLFFPAAAICGMAIGRASFINMSRAQAYRLGWLDGRTKMLNSLTRAQIRDVPISAWALIELNRDLSISNNEDFGEE